MAEELPLARLVHAMPGRARLRIAERRGDTVLFAAIATGLSAIPGVHKAEIRPLTGSILIQHGPPLDRILSAATEARLFSITDGIRQIKTPEAAPLDPKLLIGLGLGALSLWQLAQGRVLPPAITLGWYAANLGGLMSDGNGGDSE